MAAAVDVSRAVEVSREESDHGHAADDPIAWPHANVAAPRYVAIGARAEADHAEALAGRELVARADAAHDPSRDHARDLHDGDTRRVALQTNGAALVVAGVGVVRRDELPRRINDISHEPADRRAIDVDVERRQEDGDAGGRADERIDGVLDTQDAAVSRREHAVGDDRDLAFGVPKEPD